MLIDLTKEEIALISDILNNVQFKVGQSELVKMSERILSKFNEKLKADSEKKK